MKLRPIEAFVGRPSHPGADWRYMLTDWTRSWWAGTTPPDWWWAR